VVRCRHSPNLMVLMASADDLADDAKSTQSPRDSDVRKRRRPPAVSMDSMMSQGDVDPVYAKERLDKWQCNLMSAIGKNPSSKYRSKYFGEELRRSGDPLIQDELRIMDIAYDAGYDGEDENWPGHEESSDSDKEADNTWSNFLTSSVGNMGSLFATLQSPFGAQERESWYKIANGVLSACASRETALDGEALRDALIPAMACALSPPDGIGIQIAIEFLEGVGDVCGAEDQIDLIFEVFSEDPNEADLVKAALHVEAKCGGARRLLPYLADNLECASKPVPRSLRVSFDDDEKNDAVTFST